jgi:Mn2+/Fe2+ NRAMP family transporter
MYVMIKEVGRYTVVSGKTILDGFRDLPGPRNWAVWLIMIPQLLAAVVTIAGIAALVGSALMIALPGNQAVYAVGIIVVSILLVISGHYNVVEKAASFMSGLLVLIVVVTAVSVFSSPGKFISGLVPNIPSDFDINFVMPWIGFILAGAAGILWFSYWVTAREYGGPQASPDDIDHFAPGDDQNTDRRKQLKKWLRVMNTTALIGVVGGGLIIVSFLTLGAELLAPKGIVPEGIGVAEDLTKLLSQVWGQAGFWMLIVAIVIALSGTVLANQDGWGRMFADATLILLNPRFRKNDQIKVLADGQAKLKDNNDFSSVKKFFYRIITDRRKLKSTYAIIFCAIIPIVVFFMVRNPVDILSVAGEVAAAHTPLVVFLTLYLNHKRLPKAFSPNIFVSACMVIAGVFFTAFAVYHLLNL